MKKDKDKDTNQEFETEHSDNSNTIGICKACGESQVINIPIKEIVNDCFFNGFTLGINISKEWLNVVKTDSKWTVTEMQKAKDEIDHVVVQVMLRLIQKYTMIMDRKIN